MESKEAEIQTGVLANVLYFFLRICCFTQEWISTVFNWIFISPGLCLAKSLSVKKSSLENRDEGFKDVFVSLDLLKPAHSALWKYLQFVFKVDKILSGLNSQWDYYQLLLTWNKKIPLIGYFEDQRTYSIELLMEYSDKRKNERGVDFSCLSTHKILGKFQIIEKVPFSNGGVEEIRIKCIWTSGKHSGEAFWVTKNSFDKNPKENTPSGIYYPPAVIIFLFEALISASAILAFLQLTKDGVHLVKVSLVSFWEWGLGVLNNI